MKQLMGVRLSIQMPEGGVGGTGFVVTICIILGHNYTEVLIARLDLFVFAVVFISLSRAGLEPPGIHTIP
jgi:hypothetical protein